MSTIFQIYFPQPDIHINFSSSFHSTHFLWNFSIRNSITIKTPLIKPFYFGNPYIKILASMWHASNITASSSCKLRTLSRCNSGLLTVYIFYIRTVCFFAANNRLKNLLRSNIDKSFRSNYLWFWLFVFVFFSTFIATVSLVFFPPNKVRGRKKSRDVFFILYMLTYPLKREKKLGRFVIYSKVLKVQHSRLRASFPNILKYFYFSVLDTLCICFSFATIVYFFLFLFVFFFVLAKFLFRYIAI